MSSKENALQLIINCNLCCLLPSNVVDLCFSNVSSTCSLSKPETLQGINGYCHICKYADGDMCCLIWQSQFLVTPVLWIIIGTTVFLQRISPYSTWVCGSSQVTEAKCSRIFTHHKVGHTQWSTHHGILLFGKLHYPKFSFGILNAPSISDDIIGQLLFCARSR